MMVPEVAVTMTVDVVDPPPPPPPPVLLPPPQAESAPKTAMAASGSSQRRTLRRRVKATRQPARARPAAGRNGLRAGRSAEAEALAAMVSVVVTPPLPVGVTLEGEKEQVAPVGRPEQAKVTAALKPFCGETVRVSEPWLPELMESAAALGVRAKDGGAAETTAVTVVVSVMFPPVPMTVMV